MTTTAAKRGPPRFDKFSMDFHPPEFAAGLPDPVDPVEPADSADPIDPDEPEDETSLPHIGQILDAPIELPHDGQTPPLESGLSNIKVILQKSSFLY